MYRKGFLQLFVFMLIFSIQTCLVYAQDIWSIKITANYNNIPLSSLLKDIEKKYPVKFYFKQNWFENDTVSINVQNATMAAFIDKLIDGKLFTVQVMNKTMIIFLPKDEVADILGQKREEGQDNSDLITIPIGNPNEVGKYSKVELKGKIVDGKNGDPLIGASIQVENTSIGAITNVKGNFSLTLAAGYHTLLISNMGYEKSEYKVKMISNGKHDFELFDKSLKINEITIFSKRVDKNVNRNQMSLLEIDAKGIKQLPSITGEKDILKTFTMMPGVKSVGEFGSGINVRGGGEDQNLYLIEDAPIFNTSHVFGLLSVINPDAVSSVTLYKGNIPASYGERVSSVMDIRIKDNNCKTISAVGGIGLYNSRLMIEGPLGKNVTFKIGGRMSYSDWLLKQINNYNLQHSSASFYDFNGLLNWNFKNNSISIFGYTSYDKFRYVSIEAYQYGSQLISANWNHYFKNNLSSALTIAHSNYYDNLDDITPGMTKSRINTEIWYSTAKYNLNFSGFSHHNINAGMQAINYSINPGKKTRLDSISLITPKTLAKEQADEAAIYINDNYEINEHFSINAGIRYSSYFYLGPQDINQYSSNGPLDTLSITGTKSYKKGSVIQTYHGLEPRVSMKVQFDSTQSVKLSYNRNYQYISLLSYSSISTPSDRWKLSDPFIKPTMADQYAIGYFRNFLDNSIETSIEAYYKKMTHLTEYKNNADLVMNSNIETELIDASGKNYGIELLFKKNKGKLDGWVSYTYSRAYKKTSGRYLSEIINGNKYYPSSYDKPHDLVIVANYHVNRRLRFGGNFTFTSGRSVSLPEYTYTTTDGNQIIYYSDRNKYRLPTYHRLDLSMSYDETLKKKRMWKGSWTLSVLNVYARKNAYSVFYKKETPSEKNDYNMYSLYKLYIIGIPFPTLTYNFIF
jgi:hypothetical protein